MPYKNVYNIYNLVAQPKYGYWRERALITYAFFFVGAILSHVGQPCATRCRQQVRCLRGNCFAPHHHPVACQRCRV